MEKAFFRKKEWTNTEKAVLMKSLREVFPKEKATFVKKEKIWKRARNCFFS